MNDQDNNVSFFRFEDLRIYAKAMDYISWMYDTLINPGSENAQFLKESFLKSAQNIALNTAEGSSRNKTQFLYYLKMAKSSVRECVVFTELAYRVGALRSEDKEYSCNQLMELTKMIGSLIASLQRSTGTSSQDDRIDDFGEPIPNVNTL